MENFLVYGFSSRGFPRNESSAAFCLYFCVEENICRIWNLKKYLAVIRLSKMNTVDDVKFRTAVKLVAIVDLIFEIICVIFLGLVLGAVMLAIILMGQEGHQEKFEMEVGQQMPMGALLIIFAICIFTFILTIIQIVADMRLLKSSDPGMLVKEAVKLARFWRSVTIIYFVFLGISLIMQMIVVRHPGDVRIGLVAIFRIVGFVFVHFYIQEMEKSSEMLPSHGGGVVYSYPMGQNHGAMVALPDPNNATSYNMYPDLKQQLPSYGYNYPTQNGPPPPYDQSMAAPPYYPNLSTPNTK